MSICLVWSHVSPKWIEIMQGEEILAEIEIRFPLKKLPKLSFPSIEEAKRWLLQKEKAVAKYIALRSLARQMLASTVLLQKLRSLGFSEAICQEVMLSCHSFCNDDDYWPRIVEKELAKGYGPRFIRWKWKAKGLPDHWIEQIATQERQKAAIAKLSRKLKNPKTAFRTLMQRGFDPEIIQSIQVTEH